MSTFLWVEDFDGGQFQEFSSAIFYQALGIEKMGFPNEESLLRPWLREHHITLATNYAEAARMIEDCLDEFDSVVLDIDLNLIGESAEEDVPVVQPILERWYGYNHKADDEEASDASYDGARDKMKGIAGYHLFLDLVLKRGFPRDRILFCSNHGDQLKTSIDESFEKARIEAPDIWRKDDSRVSDWVSHQQKDPYLRLRRWIILACREVLEQMSHDQCCYKMANLPGDATSKLSVENAKVLLETLPRLLPVIEPAEREKQQIFRLFVRSLTQDWDKVVFKSKELKSPDKAFAAVLKNARNWTSHDMHALSMLDEADVAFLFLIMLRASFSRQDKGDRLEKFEEQMLPLLGAEVELDMSKLKTTLKTSYEEIQGMHAELAERVDEPRGYFSNMVNNLQQKKAIPADNLMQRLMQILWHQLSWQNDEGEFSPQLKHFNKPKFLDQLTRRTFARSFS